MSSKRSFKLVFPLISAFLLDKRCCCTYLGSKQTQIWTHRTNIESPIVHFLHKYHAGHVLDTEPDTGAAGLRKALSILLFLCVYLDGHTDKKNWVTSIFSYFSLCETKYMSCISICKCTYEILRTKYIKCLQVVTNYQVA